MGQGFGHVAGRRGGGGEDGVERQGDGAGEEVQPALAVAVDWVAEDGAAEGLAVDADLVGAAGFGA